MNSSNRKPFTLDRIVRIIIGLLILVIIGIMIHRLSNVLLPFLAAWLFAYLLYPLLRFFQYKLRVKNRMLAIAITLIVVFGFIFLVGLLLIPPIITESVKAAEIVRLMIINNTFGIDIPPTILDPIQQFLSKFSEQSVSSIRFEDLMSLVLPYVWKMITGASNLIINIVLGFMVILYLIFILKDYERISTYWIELIPKHYRPFIIQVGDDLKEGMNKYFRGQALIALIVGILFSIGFSIINLPMGLIFGLLVGLMNMVPYLQTVALIPGMLLAAIKATEYNQPFFLVAISVLAVFAIVQLIEEVFLTPKIMGKATGLNPAIILLSLSIWGALFGMVGMIMALPVTTLMISYYKRFVIKENMIEKLVLDTDIPIRHAPYESGSISDKESEATLDS